MKHGGLDHHEAIHAIGGGLDDRTRHQLQPCAALDWAAWPAVADYQKHRVKKLKKQEGKKALNRTCPCPSPRDPVIRLDAACSGASWNMCASGRWMALAR
jgi:hypothetical protein